LLTPGKRNGPQLAGAYGCGYGLEEIEVDGADGKAEVGGVVVA